MAFDPDLYLQRQVEKGDVAAKAKGFDPDAYLKTEAPKPKDLGVVKAAKDVAKGTASLADTGINLLNSGAEWALQGALRTAMSPEEAYQKSRLQKDVLGKTFGIENDPAYTGQATKYYGKKILESDAAQFVAENFDKGADWISENSGIPKRDVMHMMETLSFALPIKIAPKGAPIVQKVGQAVDAVDSKVTQGINRLADESGIRKAEVLRNPVPVTDNIPPQTKANVLLEGKSDNFGLPPGMDPMSPEAGRIRAGQSTISGVGSASPDAALLRVNRAKEMGVDLTRGQATKDMGQLQFEHDIARGPNEAGKPLLDRRDQQNMALTQKIDSFIDETGSEFSGVSTRKTGELADTAIKKSYEADKKIVDDNYKLAKETNIDTYANYRELNDFIHNLTPSQRDIPPVKLVIEKLAKNESGDPNIIKINDLQAIRAEINRSTNAADSTQLHFASELKTKIDNITFESGDDLWKKAITSRRELAKKFENRSIVDKLLDSRSAKHSGDRKIALEDVQAHIVTKSSLDDLKHIAGILKKTPEGQKAWKEIQAQTIRDIKEAVTSSIQRDALGNAPISAATLDKLIRQLDADGKLDYMFGKRGAQQLRDLRDVVLDINQTPIGANTSGTTHAGLRAMKRLADSKLDPALFGLGGVIRKFYESKALNKEVGRALNYTPEEAARALREKK